MLKTAPDLLQVQFRDRFVALPTWEQAMILAALERLSAVLNAESIDAAPLLDAGAIDRRHTAYCCRQGGPAVPARPNSRMYRDGRRWRLPNIHRRTTYNSPLPP